MSLFLRVSPEQQAHCSPCCTGPPQRAPPLPPLSATVRRYCRPPSPTARAVGRLDPPPSFRHACAGPPFPPCFFSSSLRHRSRPSALVSIFLVRVVVSKMKCVGVALSIRGFLASTPSCRRATRSKGFEAASPPTPCSR
jgi:hypothetical protein